LAQLVSEFIITSGFDGLDSNTVFLWTLEIVPDGSKRDNTKKKVIQIPHRIPPGFNLRVMANTLHADSDGRKQVTRRFGAAKVRFTLQENETLGRLSVIAVDWMTQRGQGDQWFIEGNPMEAIDSDFEHKILPIPQVEEVMIYLKQVSYKIRVNEPWTAFSDRLVTMLGLPRGTLFRIYPVDGDIQRLRDDDHPCSFDWKNGAQYWFEIVDDLSRDRHNLTREIRMVDHAGRVESFVIPGNTQIEEVRNLWGKVIDCPANVVLQCNSHNAEEYCWGFGETISARLVACTLRSASAQANATVYDGSDTFRADKMSRMLGVKTPPFAQSRISVRPEGGIIIDDPDEWMPLELRVIREHALDWVLEGTVLDAPQVTTWWVRIRATADRSEERFKEYPEESLRIKLSSEPQESGNPASRSRADAGPPPKGPEPKATKAAAPPRAPAGKTQSKGQESPETKVSKPVPKKNSAGRAGSLRSGGGSGQTDTCVAQGNPSKT
jgi:hypothetical protein